MRPGRPWVDPLPRQFDAGKYCAAADRIIAGEFDVFALRPAQLGFPPQWNRDPKTGRVAPLTFGKALDYRDERIVGDIKYLWEPSRHAELLTLAQAWHLSRDQRYAAACRTLLDSWFEQCPYARGPHWTSSLEHAMRLINWSFAWHLLGDEREPLRRALADLDLSALPLHRRPLLAPFVREQSSARRADRPVRRRDHVAAVAAVAILARNCAARAAAAGAGAERQRRRQSRAGGLVPPRSGGHAAHRRPRGARQRDGARPPTTGSAWKRCSTTSRASWMSAATCPTSATRTMPSSRGSIPRRTLTSIARCSRPARSCSIGPISSSRQARSTTRVAGCSAIVRPSSFACPVVVRAAIAGAAGISSRRLLRARARARHAARGAHRRRRRAGSAICPSPRMGTPTRCRSR